MGAFFSLDTSGVYLDKTCFMLIAENPMYIQASLSSKLFEFAYKRIFSSVELGEHGYQYNKHALVKLPLCNKFEIMNDYSDEYFYKLYNLTCFEIDYIEESTQSLHSQ